VWEKTRIQVMTLMMMWMMMIKMTSKIDIIRKEENDARNHSFSDSSAMDVTEL